MTSETNRLSLSVMLIVSDAAAAVAWYQTALGAGVLWDLGGVAGLHLGGAPFFVHEAVPGKASESSPTDVGLTTTRIEVFVDEPGRFIDRAADPFGHRWSVGDRTPLERLAR
jgi:catechol 2,3-dioxygenase-like lactoylglutathione lyase family enzyme